MIEKTYRVTGTDVYTGRLFKEEGEWYVGDSNPVGDIVLEFCCPDQVRVYDGEVEIPLSGWSPQELGSKLFEARTLLLESIWELKTEWFGKYVELAAEITQKVNEAVEKYEKGKTK